MSSSLLYDLKNLRTVLIDNNKVEHAEIVSTSITNLERDIDLNSIFNNNDWWGGGGSIADLFITSDEFGRLLVKIGQTLINEGVQNDRMVFWINCYQKYLNK